MVNEEELPESIAERAKVMENTLIDAATGGPLDEDTYGHLPVSRLYRESWENEAGTMRTGSRRTDVGYTWPRTLRTEHPFEKAVYLDLNHWIELAKTLSGHRDGRKNLDVLATFEKAVADGAVVLPLSFTTYLEISKIHNRRQRRNLRDVIDCHVTSS